MAHELAKKQNGQAAIAYVGETPWHGLGQQLSEGMPIETWQTEAGMDWDILSTPVTMNLGYLTGDTPAPDLRQFPGKTVLYRSDTKEPLSIVSDKYKVVQPKEVLEFFRDLTEDLGMKLSTAGVLFEGRKFWALADTGMAGKVLGNDEIKGNLLLTSSCDGTSPTVAQFTSVRVVCNNTLQISLKEGGVTKASVRHRTTFSPEDIKQSLGLLHDSWDGFMKSINTLATTEMNDKKAREFFENLMAKDKQQVLDMPNVLVRNVDELMNLYKNGIGANMAYGTAWGVLNAVTEMTDWHNGGRVADTRMWNAWNGKNSDLKTKAFEQLMAV